MSQIEGTLGNWNSRQHQLREAQHKKKIRKAHQPFCVDNTTKSFRRVSDTKMRKQHRSNKLSKNVPTSLWRHKDLLLFRRQEVNNQTTNINGTYQSVWNLKKNDDVWCRRTQQRSNKLVKKWPGSTSTVLVKQTGVILSHRPSASGKTDFVFSSKSLKAHVFSSHQFSVKT